MKSIKFNTNRAAAELLATRSKAHPKGGLGRSFGHIPTLPPQNSRCCVAIIGNQVLSPLREPLQTVARSLCGSEVAKDWGAALRRRSAPRILWRAPAVLSVVFLTSCRGAPSINLMGSFFPGWMLCIALGVLGALVLRQVFIRTNIEADLGPRPLVYFCLWGLITLTLYLLFFRS